MNILSTDPEELYRCVRYAQKVSRPRRLFANRAGRAVVSVFLLPKEYRHDLSRCWSLNNTVATLLAFNQAAAANKKVILP